MNKRTVKEALLITVGLITGAIISLVSVLIFIELTYGRCAKCTEETLTPVYNSLGTAALSSNSKTSLVSAEAYRQDIEINLLLNRLKERNKCDRIYYEKNGSAIPPICANASISKPEDDGIRALEPNTSLAIYTEQLTLAIFEGAYSALQDQAHQSYF